MVIGLKIPGSKEGNEELGKAYLGPEHQKREDKKLLEAELKWQKKKREDEELEYFLDWGKGELKDVNKERIKDIRAAFPLLMEEVYGFMDPMPLKDYIDAFCINTNDYGFLFIKSDGFEGGSTLFKARINKAAFTLFCKAKELGAEKIVNFKEDLSAPNNSHAYISVSGYALIPKKKPHDHSYV